MPTLTEVMPSEFAGVEYEDTRAYTMREVQVAQAFRASNEATWRRWPGKHKHVYLWVILTNGYAVGWNENPARGWSFPVIRYAQAQEQTNVA